jgi:hypothetical protein
MDSYRVMLTARPPTTGRKPPGARTSGARCAPRSLRSLRCLRRPGRVEREAGSAGLSVRGGCAATRPAPFSPARAGWSRGNSPSDHGKRSQSWGPARLWPGNFLSATASRPTATPGGLRKGERAPGSTTKQALDRTNGVSEGSAQRVARPERARAFGTASIGFSSTTTKNSNPNSREEHRA